MNPKGYRLFNTDTPSPYELIPIESLVFPQQQQHRHQPSMYSPQNHMPINNNSNNTLQSTTKPLDIESGYKLLEYLNSIGGTLDISDEKMALFEREKRSPPSRAQHQSYNSPDNIAKTVQNVARLTKDVLAYNGVTLAIIVGRCRIAVSNLRGSLAPRFQDLIDLGFNPEDLLIDRTLFNCNTLYTLYGGSEGGVLKYAGMLSLGCSRITLNHLMMQGGFTGSELTMLGFTMGDMVDRGEIKRGQLSGLKFSYTDLVQMGLCRQHLSVLAIDEEFATLPTYGVNNTHGGGRTGLGWTRDEFRLLTRCGVCVACKQRK
jgi:hypothetical protein